MEEYESQKGKLKEVYKVISRNFVMEILDEIQLEGFNTSLLYSSIDGIN
jgi:hypothetical protein